MSAEQVVDDLPTTPATVVSDLLVMVKYLSEVFDLPNDIYTILRCEEVMYGMGAIFNFNPNGPKLRLAIHVQVSNCTATELVTAFEKIDHGLYEYANKAVLDMAVDNIIPFTAESYGFSMFGIPGEGVNDAPLNHIVCIEMSVEDKSVEGMQIRDTLESITKKISVMQTVAAFVVEELIPLLPDTVIKVENYDPMQPARKQAIDAGRLPEYAHALMAGMDREVLNNTVSSMMHGSSDTIGEDDRLEQVEFSK